MENKLQELWNHRKDEPFFPFLTFEEFKDDLYKIKNGTHEDYDMEPLSDEEFESWIDEELQNCRG